PRPASLFEPKGDAADRKLVPVLQALARPDDLAVDDGPVRAARVLDPPFAVGKFDESVARGCRLVVDHDVVARVSPERVHRAERQAITDARRAAHRALYDKMREA